MTGAAPDPLDRWHELRQPIVRALNLPPLVPPQADDETMNVVDDAWSGLHDIWKELAALLEVARAARAFETWQPGIERAMEYLHPQERGALLELRAALARLEDKT